jgi:flagellar protein FlgJ
MPDSIKGLGKMTDIRMPQLGSVADRSLLQFQPGLGDGKKVQDRSTLAITQDEKTIKAQNEKAATDFEALLLQQMVQSMWRSVPSEGMLSGSNEEAMYRDMLSEQVAKEMAETQSLGIKNAVLGEMGRKQKL